MEGVQEVADHMVEEELPKVSKVINASILDSFSTLESDVETNRISAGVALLRELSDKQHENEDNSISIEVNYALTRLIRGLGGIKTTKRAGCFSVLVGLLSSTPVITIQDMVERAKKEVRVSKDSTKSEQTGAYISQVLVFGALIRSGVFLKGSHEDQQTVLLELMKVWKKKREYLSLVIASFIRDLMEKAEEDCFRDTIWPVLKIELSRSWEDHTLDTLYLLLIARENFPDVVKKKFLVKHLNSKMIIHDEMLAACSELLMNSPLPLCKGHPVLEEVCHHVSNSKLEIPFWDAFVIEYQKRASGNREECLLKFLNCLLHNLEDKTKIPEFLNDSFVEQVLKTLKAKGTKGGLSQMVIQIFENMATFLKDDDIDDEVRINFLKRLLLYPGNVTFDKLASTNLVVLVASNLKMEGVKQLAGLLREVVSAQKPKIKNSSGETGHWNKWERIHAARMLCRLLSLPVVQHHLKWKVQQTIFLFSIGLFAPSADEAPASRLILSGEAREFFWKVLDYRAASLVQLCSYLNSVVRELNVLLFTADDPVKLHQPLSETAKAAWQKMIAVVGELESSLQESASKKSEKQMFLVLFLHMGLQLLQNAVLAEEMLAELHNCYARTHEAKDKKKSKKSKMDTTATEEPHWVEVVVDLFLSLLSRNSHLFRRVVAMAFPYLCPYLTQVALLQILEVLNPFAKRPLTDQDAPDESDDSESEEEEDKPGDESENVEEDKDSDMSEDEDVEGDLENEPVNLHLKMAVQKALTQAGGDDSDQESIDMDNMTEEEGKRLDEALSNAFKLLKRSQSDAKNKKQSKDDETLMNFRVRVIDLLDIFISNKPDLGKVLDIMLPLFDLLEFCIKDIHQAPLERRVRHCLRKLCAVKQFSSTANVDQELLATVLQQLLQKGERAAAVFQNMGEPLVHCTTFLARTAHILAQEHQGDATSHVLDVLIDSLTMFFKKRDSLLPLEVFKSVLNLPWEGTLELASAVTNFSLDADIRPFRRHQALVLLIAFYSNDRSLIQMSEGNRKKLQALEKTLSQHAVEILLSGGVSYKDKYIQELLNLLVAVWQAYSRHKEIKVSTGMDWETLRRAVVQYCKGRQLTRSVKSALKRLARVLKVSIDLTRRAEKQVEKNMETESSDEEEEEDEEEEKSEQDEGEGEEEEDEEEDENEEDDEDDKVGENGVSGEESEESEVNGDSEEKGVAKKVKKKRQKLKAKNRAVLKKQSAEARELAMSEGLDSFTFSEVNMEDIKEPDEGEVKGKKRKLKEKAAGSEVVSGGEETVAKKKAKKLKNKENGIQSSKKKKHKGTT